MQNLLENQKLKFIGKNELYILVYEDVKKIIQ